MSRAFDLRLATPDDLEPLVALEARAFRDPWSAVALHEEIGHPQGLTLVAVRPRGPVVGYVSFRRLVGESELLRIAVEPDWQRLGVATALLAAGLGWIDPSGHEPCHLEVAAGNAAALAFYARHGFAEVGRRRGYYRGGEAAVLMRRGEELDAVPE